MFVEIILIATCKCNLHGNKMKMIIVQLLNVKTTGLFEILRVIWCGMI